MKLAASDAEVRVPVIFWSLAGYHSFGAPMWKTDGDRLEPISLPELALLLLKEDGIGGSVSPDARLLFQHRVLDSMRSIATLVRERADERPFSEPGPDFITAETALRFGHAVHPFPRSRDEFTDEDNRRFGPEYGNVFALRWWAVEPELVAQGTVEGFTMADAIASIAASDSRLIEKAAGRPLIPLHPWQAARLSLRPDIQQLERQGKITDLGSGHPCWRATSSLRAIYSPDSDWMLKFSLSLRLTNSRRIVEPRECLRGMNVHRLITGTIGKALKNRFPDFHIMGEPGWISLRLPDGSIDSETIAVFRENPFRGAQQPHAAVLAALCERHPDGSGSHVADLIRRIAASEGAPESDVAKRWFERFLEIVIAPFMIAQGDYGLIFGAHQQNIVLGLQDGWPNALYFRDCQGTGYVRSFLPFLREYLPEAGAATDHVFDSDDAARLAGYYLFINGVFALIAALGSARFVDESELFASLQHFLEQLGKEPLRDRTTLEYLLHSPTLAAKGNFMISAGNVNENTDVTDPLASYIRFSNPLSTR
ncbi:IucA/IucC family protein [Brucella anthropi]|uniref:IucA/IucC family protein n=1 Tax=Brucella anthropi TaxID=529 RepID=UPI003987B7E0